SPTGPRSGSFIEPEVFEARAVVDAVDLDRIPLQLRLPAGADTSIKDHRPGVVLRQFPFDFPHQLLALPLVGFERLLVDQLVEVRVTITAIITLRTAYVILVE